MHKENSSQQYSFRHREILPLVSTQCSPSFPSGKTTSPFSGTFSPCQTFPHHHSLQDSLWALLPPRGPCASTSPGTVALGGGWGARQGWFPHCHCVTAPLLLHHCLSPPVVSLPLTPGLVCLSPKSWAHTLPPNPSGRGGLAVLSWSCSCQGPDPRRAQLLQAGNWPLQLLLSAKIIPGKINFAWGICCKEFVMITGTKVCRRKLFSFFFF